MKRAPRGTVVVDRVVAAVVGLLLVVGGAALVALGTGWLQRRRPALADTLDTSWVATQSARSWWPWALAVVAVVLAVVAVWWLAAHRPEPRAGTLPLRGEVPGARLWVASGPVVEVVSGLVERDPQVRSTSLALVRERGRLVLTGAVVVDSDADLDSVTDAVASGLDELGRVLGRDDVETRIHLGVASRGRTARRLH
ncbi:hypothetical protein GCM10023221_21970 [Luteimicrobium xylanilyticum]|uniref:Alkaline shock response membrane anchor protein AmaP n=1 Tax=Luteimicrobium xylanilyticum TaxID=1133546 RepID=A0A5P9Q6Y9_9MICO|nr:hypothetical protein [Luteimicrobium xylanilyticum]QFU96870.1 hypothetical protein KDY119_00360 [Luteimicrobium xylanilyticum]